MTDEEIDGRLTEIFREVFGDDAMRLRPDLSADQVEGWDSVRMVTIIVAVEERFGIRLRSREVDGLKTVGDLAALIRAKV